MGLIGRGLLCLAFIIFCGIGLMLLTDHPGVAIKLSNYVFPVIVSGIVLGYYFNE